MQKFSFIVLALMGLVVYRSTETRVAINAAFTIKMEEISRRLGRSPAKKSTVSVFLIRRDAGACVRSDAMCVIQVQGQGQAIELTADTCPRAFTEVSRTGYEAIQVTMAGHNGNRQINFTMITEPLGEIEPNLCN